MAKRDMNSTLETASERISNTFYELVKITVGSKTYRLSNAPYSITISGDGDYTSFGPLIGFSDIEENATLEIQTLTIQISGIVINGETSITPVDDFLNTDYTHAPVSIRRVYTDDSGIVGNFEIFKGYITGGTVAVNSSDSCSVSIAVANHWSDFDREAGRYTNSTSQQRYFAGDTGFAYASEIQKEIKWKAAS